MNYTFRQVPSPTTATTCYACAPGTADLDATPATPCDPCAVGRFSNETADTCTQCALGTADLDEDPATPCSNCTAGFFSVQAATMCTHRAPWGRSTTTLIRRPRVPNVLLGAIAERRAPSAPRALSVGRPKHTDQGRTNRHARASPLPQLHMRKGVNRNPSRRPELADSDSNLHAVKMTQNWALLTPPLSRAAGPAGWRRLPLMAPPLLLPLLLGAASAATPLNVITVLTDDQGFGDTGHTCDNSTGMCALTPNIDAMARSNHSAVFHRFYSAAGVCSPTRAALL
eukprot:COSAG06_NODE_4185_length_4494_cov_31.643231_4_plen_285_part_00